MTAEAIGFACERLFECGAVEVYTVPIGMKKSRPGTLLKAICSAERREAVVQAFFAHTTTIGVREIKTKRYVLDRRITVQQTPYGPVHSKVSSGYGVERTKIEYEDLRRIALEQGISLFKAARLIEQSTQSKEE